MHTSRQAYGLCVAFVLCIGLSISFAHALHDAARLGDLDGVKRHIAQGADVNEQDRNGSTPLFIAAIYGHAAVVELLLAHGADVHVKARGGATPLYVAAGSELRGDGPPNH
jgi:ankyrin repeat protein